VSTIVQTYIEQGNDLFNEEHPDEALSYFANLRSTYPDNAEVWLHSAFTFDRLGRESEAIPLYIHALELGLQDENLRDCLVCLSSSYRVVGQPDVALSHLERARSLFPQDLVVLSFLSLTLHDLQRSSEAVQLLGLALIQESPDQNLASYQRPLRYYFQHIAKQQPSEQ